MRSHSKNVTKQFISLIIELVDPPVLAKMHPVMSPDLQKALGAIQQGAEEWMEVLRDQKHKLELGEQSEIKLVLGHLEFVEESEVLKTEKEEAGTGDGNEPPHKQRVTQSISALKDARRRENISKQEL